MASFVLSFSPLDVLDEIWDLIESVSEGFLTYSCVCEYNKYCSNYNPGLTLTYFTPSSNLVTLAFAWAK